MTHLLDTNIAILFRDGAEGARERIGALGDLPQISIVTQVELESGLARKTLQWELRQVRLDAFLARVVIHDFNKDCAKAYRAIIASVGFSRPRVLDRMIAATALVHGLTLATGNGADFRDVPGLRLEEW